MGIIAKIAGWFGYGYDWIILNGVRKLLNLVKPLNGYKTILGILVLVAGKWLVPFVPAEYSELVKKVFEAICAASEGQCEAVQGYSLSQIVMTIGTFLTGLGVFGRALNLPTEKPVTLPSGLPPAKTVKD